ncbi:cytochrome c3 family protein [Caulobacter sp. S45]|uniref:cytochrome c3 family protein n=1 Tax=Caulobacter sp. S45 TaxID=1641861 RepID=UPI00131DCD98|nr:cytochrome c3 family protein [Caulobacter sp. S45]
MAQLFRPGADTIARVVLFALAIAPFAGVALAYGLRVSPYSTEQNLVVDQPVPFSHKHHVGDLGIDCRYCHTSVEKAAFASLPPSSTCMTCHSQIWTNAALLAPVRDSFAHHTPIRWNKVHRVADYVYFDHSIHVAKGVPCSTCHGPVHEMPLMRQTKPMTMQWCLDCHRNPGPNLAPRDKEFDPSWTPAQDPLHDARAYIARYHIHPAHLTDCTVCHR